MGCLTRMCSHKTRNTTRGNGLPGEKRDEVAVRGADEYDVGLCLLGVRGTGVPSSGGNFQRQYFGRCWSTRRLLCCLGAAVVVRDRVAHSAQNYYLAPVSYKKMLAIVLVSPRRVE